jgi:hypothetical protein
VKNEPTDKPADPPGKQDVVHNENYYSAGAISLFYI